MSEQAFYRWKKQYGGLAVNELRRLKQLEEETRRLKQLVGKKIVRPERRRELARHLDGPTG